MTSGLMEFRALLGPDGTARVLYVRSSEPVPSTCLLRTFWLTEAEQAAEQHNRERDEREALKAAGQGELFR